LILLIAILTGMITGMLRARLNNLPLQTIKLRSKWLLLMGILPQLLTFQIPLTSISIPSLVIIASFLLLIAFTWLNRKQPGFWLLLSGLALELAATLLQTNAAFYWLSDRLYFPISNGFIVTFNAGDVFLSIGTLLYFWSLGGPINENKEFRNVIPEHT